MDRIYLIAGLGNPGREYAGTRHNIGFMLVERLAAEWNAGWTHERKFSADLAKVERGGKKIMLCRPRTYMNASGEAIGALVRFYQAALEQVLMVVDDADLPLGQIRLRAEGSSGGHHGLESIEQQLGTRAYARMRLGIGRRAGDGRQIAGYVLGRFTAEERKTVEEILARASQQADCWLTAGVKEAMNRFNGAVSTPSSKGKTE